MTRIHTLHAWPEGAGGSPTWRRYLAEALRRASIGLARLAVQLQSAPAPTRTATTVLEFYAEAGAPEGALYADGQFVCKLEGVKRL